MRFALCALAAMLASTVGAQAQSDSRGYYLEGGGGVGSLNAHGGFYQLRPDHPTLPNMKLDADSIFDRGWAVSGRLGHAWLTGWRADLELAYRRNSVEKSKFTGTDGVNFFQREDLGARGHSYSFAILANGYFDFLNASILTPYIGAGIGAVQVGGKFNSSYNPIIQHSDSSNDSDWGLAVQGTAGLSVALSKQLSLVADYRYLRAFDISTSEEQYPPATPAQAFAAARIGGKGDFEWHTVMVGLRYSFGSGW